MKSKNGQKYIINQYNNPEGFYVTKTWAFLYFLLLIIMMILAALLTYLLCIPKYVKSRSFFGKRKLKILIYLFLHHRTCLTDSTNGSQETQVHTGSLFHPSPNGGSYESHSNGDGVLSDQAKNDDPIVIEDEIEFPDGWTPVHYE